MGKKKQRKAIKAGRTENSPSAGAGDTASGNKKSEAARVRKVAGRKFKLLFISGLGLILLLALFFWGRRRPDTSWN